MNRLTNLENALNNILMWIAGLTLMVMIFHIGAVVIMRSVFNRSLDGSIGMVTYYYMVAVTVLPLAAVQSAKQHVIVEVFTKSLKSKYKRALDGGVTVISIAYIGVIAWAAFHKAIDSYVKKEIRTSASLDLLLWPSRWILFVGFGALLFVLIRQLLTRDFERDSE